MILRLNSPSPLYHKIREFPTSEASKYSSYYCFTASDLSTIAARGTTMLYYYRSSSFIFSGFLNTLVTCRNRGTLTVPVLVHVIYHETKVLERGNATRDQAPGLLSSREWCELHPHHDLNVINAQHRDMRSTYASKLWDTISAALASHFQVERTK